MGHAIVPSHHAEMLLTSRMDLYRRLAVRAEHLAQQALSRSRLLMLEGEYVHSVAVSERMCERLHWMWLLQRGVQCYWDLCSTARARWELILSVGHLQGDDRKSASV